MPSRFAAALDRLRPTRSPLDVACEHLAAHNDRVLDWQCAVTRVAAPTGREAARADWMAAHFATLGWPVLQRDSVGNLIARRTAVADRSMDGAVWVCAHLDTVFDDPAPAVHRRDTRLEGPGIGDNGRGLAALLAIADAMQVADITTPREIILACTVGEEGLGDLRGMKHLLRESAIAPHAVIAIDGAGDDRIVNGALGSRRWRITFAGEGGHSWADYGVVNPVHAAAALVTALNAILLPRDPRTTMTVARIGGGESINSIPRAGWLEVDLRSLSASVLDDVERTVRQAVARIEKGENARRADGSPLLTSRIDVLGDRPCGMLASDAPLVRLAEQVTRAMGRSPRLATGSTDASVAIAMGIPAIAIGAGGVGGGTHTPSEWYEDTRGTLGLQRALRIVVGAAALR